MAKAKKLRQAPVGKEKWTGARVALALAAGVGVVTSIYLAAVHVDVKAGSEIGGLCNISEALNCAASAQSVYSEVFGIPVALLGLGFYLATLALVAFGRSGKQGWDGSEYSAGRILVVLFGFSVLYSLFLAIVSATQLSAFCPGCMILYAVNGAGLAAAWIWSGSRPDQALMSQLRSISLLPSAPAVLGFVVLFGLSVAVSYGVVDERISAAKGQATPATAQAQNQTPISRDRLNASYAPSKGADGAPVEIVVFANPECPHCATLDKNLDALFNNFSSSLRIEYRHLVNPDRAAAGLALVCAQKEGKYFELLDALFANMPVRGRGDLDARMRNIGLDPRAMGACMESTDAQSQLQADLQSAQNLGVRGTPTFFVNGIRYVGALGVGELSELVRSRLDQPQSSSAP